MEPIAAPCPDGHAKASARTAWLIDAYTLLSGLLLEAPSSTALTHLHASGALDDLEQRARDLFARPAAGLDELRRLLASGAASCGALAAEHRTIFLGPQRPVAPPWESVYRSPDRLVMQQPAYEVLQAYVEAGLGYDDMQRCPPDHVGRELAFVASVLTRAAQQTPPADDDLRRAHAFWRDHLVTWLPSFCDDLQRAAGAGYQHVAVLLREVTAHDPLAGSPVDTTAAAPPV